LIYLRKILVPTDLSQVSLAAMEHAASFGLLYGSRLYLLHVVEHSPGRGAPGREAEKELEEFIAGNVKQELKLVPITRTGNPAAEIITFAEEEGIDLIVMATHGRTGLSHMVMGSVAEKVVRLSRIPVLTVKPPQMTEQIMEDEDIEHELHLR